jgi:hypothetical protein
VIKGISTNYGRNLIAGTLIKFYASSGSVTEIKIII